MNREGTLLGDRYRLGATIGTGGMSDVYAAVDELLGRDVAVKMMRPDLARDKNFLERFRREAQNAAKLNHPAIVAVYDTAQTPEEDGAVPYIVMERVHGETLRDIIQDYGKMQLKDAAEIMAAVAEALHVSHEAGIIHRDIKPANIMITNTGAVKVMDFGIACALSDASAAMTQTAAVIGTAQYLSPEQAKGKAADSRSDIYAAGCVFYELTTGQPPFQGESPFSVAFQHVQDEPPVPSHAQGMQLNHREAFSLDAIALTAMAKNPADRYDDAQELATDLRRLAAGQVPLVAKAHQDAQAGPDSTTVLPAQSDSGEDSARHRAGGAAGAAGAAGLAGLAGAAGAARGANAANADQYGAAHDPQYAEQQGEHAGAYDQDYANGYGDSYANGYDYGDDYNAEYADNYDDGYGEYAYDRDYADDYPEDYQEGRRRRWLIPLVAIGAVLCLVGGAGAMYYSNNGTLFGVSGSKRITIPDVANKPRAEAEAALSDANLNFRTTERPSADVPRGHAIGTEPGANSTVQRKTTITLIISSGKEITEVPDLTGMNTKEASAALKKAGLKLNSEVEEKSSDTVESGDVISQSPAQGSQVSKGTKVTITVSTGKEEVKVPRVTGQSLEVARTNLEAAGFTVEVTEVDSEKESGTVTSAEGEGSEQPKGTKITLEVSKGNQFIMPNLKGQRFSSVAGALRAAGWSGNPSNVDRVNVKTNDLTKVDKVAHQTVPAGKPADKNSNVEVGVYVFDLLP